jgi:hypothetical protein
MDTFVLLALLLGMELCVHPAGITAEIIRIAVVAIAECKIVIEDEVEVVKQIDNDRRIGDGGEAHGFRTAIDVRAPRIQRRRNYAAALPLNRPLVGAGCPNHALACAA